MVIGVWWQSVVLASGDHKLKTEKTKLMDLVHVKSAVVDQTSFEDLMARKSEELRCKLSCHSGLLTTVQNYEVRLFKMGR
ncbi:hypothetical protein AVEN_23926-1 [Araneus ventricosus]|uniref:Uncharacterized protein n=1 Tax=Araneus ventricosus TaxID=182803 RepID=A0A4Y2HLF1_ARAVE|nr:hypothetical protein AVEN_23926-1 [Araneus ventricosus]